MPLFVFDKDDLTIVHFLIIAYFVISQIVKALAILKISKKHEIDTDVLAILPFLNNIYIYSIVDKYSKNSGKRKFLKVVFMIFSGLALAAVITVPVSILMSFETINKGLLLFLLVLAGAIIIYKYTWPFLIIYYILYLYFLYDFYKIEKPKYRWLFFVLSIIGFAWLPLYICGRAKENDDLKQPIDTNT